VCVLLDNAADADQIRALLPGGPGHLVVITNRAIVAALARDGAVHHHLGPLDSAAALDYLTLCLGEHRVTREHQAAVQLANLCAGLPMALALVVTELASHPERALAHTVATFGEPRRPRTRPARNRLEAAVPSALDHAYENLPRTTPVARVYRILGRLFVLDFDSALTAAVCELTTSAAEEALRTLHAARLIEQAPGDDNARGPVYRFHDAARAHAAGRATQDETPGEGDEALRRALDFLLAATTQAEYRLTDTHRRLARTYKYRPAEPLLFASDAAAMAWLEAQRDNLRAAILTANAAGIFSVVWQLAHALWPLLRASHDYVLWFESHRLGLAAARRCGDGTAVLELLNTWAVGLRGAGRFEEAANDFAEVLRLARAAEDQRAEPQALHELGSVYLEMDRLEESERYLTQARELRRTLRDTSEDELDQRTFRRAVAITEVCLGQVHLKVDRVAEAIGTLDSAHATLVSLKDRFDAGRALAWLGFAYSLWGDPATAEGYGRQAVDEFDATNSLRWRARSRELLGLSLRAAGQLDDAIAEFTESARIYSIVSRRDEERVRRRLREA
jgi:tetratricopeptide (TPR) repeat protein